MPDHHFNPELAKKYGVDAAIFLHNIYFWMKYNKAYQKNFYEGRYWTFNSLAAFCEAHPYWSRRQIERIVATCRKEELLLTGCFNQDRRDRTVWYSLSDKALEYFTDVTTKTDDCISPNSEMHDTERGQSFPQTVTPLPYKNPDNSLEDNSPHSPPEGDKPARKRKRREPKNAPDWKPERFEGFWKFYPLKKSKQAAIRAWDLLRPDDALLAVMGRALQRQVASPEWQRKIREDAGQGIPYPATWLNGRRWEDEDKPSGASAPPPEPPQPRSWYTEIIDGEEVVVYDDPGH